MRLFPCYPHMVVTVPLVSTYLTRGQLGSQRYFECAGWAFVVEGTDMADGGHKVVELTRGVELTEPCIFMSYPFGCSYGVWVGCWCSHCGLSYL